MKRSLLKLFRSEPLKLRELFAADQLSTNIIDDQMVTGPIRAEVEGFQRRLDQADGDTNIVAIGDDLQVLLQYHFKRHANNRYLSGHVKALAKAALTGHYEEVAKVVQPILDAIVRGSQASWDDQDKRFDDSLFRFLDDCTIWAEEESTTAHAR